MQELVIVTWCDVCRANELAQSKAVLTLKLTLDGVAYGLDLCETHQAEPVALSGLAEFLEQCAVKGGDATAPRAKTAQAVSELPYQCPACERRYLRRNSLAAHARQNHNRVLSSLELEMGVVPDPSAFVCEVCGTTAVNPQGLAAHKRAAHGILGKEAARKAQLRAAAVG